MPRARSLHAYDDPEAIAGFRKPTGPSADPDNPAAVIAMNVSQVGRPGAFARARGWQLVLQLSAGAEGNGSRESDAAPPGARSAT